MATKNKPRRSASFGLVIGVGLGLLVGLVFKKMAIGLLLAIAVAYMLYSVDQK
jgi:hypothetical protein